MEKEEKTKFIEKLKNQIKELTKTERMSYEDIEEKPITTLDKKLLKKYQEIFEEIMQICEKEKIDEISKFDENYPVFQWGLQNFLDNYARSSAVEDRARMFEFICLGNDFSRFPRLYEKANYIKEIIFKYFPELSYSKYIG